MFYCFFPPLLWLLLPSSSPAHYWKSMVSALEGEDQQGVRGRVSDTLAWKDLTVMVTLSNGDTQNVLEKLSNHAEPGSFTALMGPSGSGKSTLLDAFSGRLAANTFLSGTILLNGRKAKLSFGTTAYVTQDDNLIGTLIMREMISYSARLRLPGSMLWADKQTLVESIIIEMGLQGCTDTIIGNWHLRGVSGDEKRRVSIAIEILMRPRLLFLNEPTSGLDSASAFFVTQTLHGTQKKVLTMASFDCAWHDDLRFRKACRGSVAFDAFAHNDVTVVFRKKIGSQHFH